MASFEYLAERKVHIPRSDEFYTFILNEKTLLYFI